MFKFLFTARALRRATLLAAAALPLAAAAADYSGYFRGGPGLTRSNVSRACYHLDENAGNGIAHGLNYRLGNECDLHGEFQVDQKYAKDGLEYSGTVMVKSYSNATDDINNDDGFKLEQLYAEVKGIDFLPEASWWIGKRRGRRVDVHIVDWFFTDMIGTGAGIGGIKFGTGLLGLAYYKTDGADYKQPGATAERPGNRLNLEVQGLDTNPGGKANLFFTVTQGQFDGGTTGLGFTVRHDQKLAGGSLLNTLWAQVASGSTSLESNFGDLTRKSSAMSYRLVESINWQVGRFGGQALASIGVSEDNNGLKTTAGTLGGRISYGITRNFKMLTELGVSRYKTDGAPAAKLTKLTIAPTLSIDNTFWSRPELRLYVTTAKWSEGAGNVTGVPSLADKTSGTSAGAQVEWWY